MTRTTRTFVALALSVGLAGCGGDEEAPAEEIIRPVRSIVVSSDDGSRSRSFSGAVRAGNETRLSFQVPGRIAELDITVGATVESGARLATVDPTDIELQIQEARASAGQARAQVRQAAASYDRIRALYANQNASRQDLDNARAQRDSTQSAAAAISQSVRRLQRQLEYATLVAPDGGTISAVSVERNEVVAAGQVIAVLQVGEQLEVAVDVPESHINRVQRGNEVEVHVDSHDEPMTGTIYEVGVPMQGSSVFPVTVRLPEDLSDVRAGMAAEVSFAFDLSEEEAPQHIVPVTSVSEDTDGRFVFVVDGDGDTGVIRRVSVELGNVGADGIEIQEGLSDGDRVVTAGVSRIHAGLEVRVLEEDDRAEPVPAVADDGPADDEGDSE
ncbi:MAG: multidrug efflux system membrane fusion protein [Polyangiales bacterium]|jgi:multidrug efflux system membrane fusion protein